MKASHVFFRSGDLYTKVAGPQEIGLQLISLRNGYDILMNEVKYGHKLKVHVVTSVGPIKYQHLAAYQTCVNTPKETPGISNTLPQ